MPPMRGNDVLAAWAIAESPNPMPAPVAMGNKEEWLMKREEGRPAPWAPEPPNKILLLPSRLEMGSWPPLAASAVEERQGKRLKTITLLLRDILTSVKQTCTMTNRIA